MYCTKTPYEFQLNIVRLARLSCAEMTVMFRLGSFCKSKSWLIIGLDTNEAPKHPTNRKYSIEKQWGHNDNHS